MIGRVTKRELEIYNEIKQMKTVSNDRENFMKMIEEKAIQDLLDSIHEIK